MARSLELLQRHPRVEMVSIEDGGDLLMVYLKAPWARYGTGRRDGWSRGFNADDYDPPLSQAANAKLALEWVRNGVFKDDDSDGL